MPRSTPIPKTPSPAIPSVKAPSHRVVLSRIPSTPRVARPIGKSGRMVKNTDARDIHQRISKLSKINPRWRDGVDKNEMTEMINRVIETTSDNIITFPPPAAVMVFPPVFSKGHGLANPLCPPCALYNNGMMSIISPVKCYKLYMRLSKGYMKHIHEENGTISESDPGYQAHLDIHFNKWYYHSYQPQFIPSTPIFSASLDALAKTASDILSGSDTE